jgi:flagellar motor component MotA
MIHETSLGLALMILVTIGGMEIAHLVSPWAALAVMGAAIVSSLVAYKRT